MFNYSLPQVLYCQAPTQFLGFPMAQRMVISLCPTIQYNPQNNWVQTQEAKNSSQSVEIHEVDKSSQENPPKVQIKKAPSSKNHKKIKRSTKTQSRSSKKSLFKNSYLSFAIHKLLTFVGNRTVSEQFTQSLIQKFKNSEEDLQQNIKLFYEQHDSVMKYIVNNASIRKIRQLWTGEFMQKVGGSNQIQQAQLFTFVYRSLSKIFFDRFYTPFLLRSKKVRRSTMTVHLKMRRYLLQNLNNPQNFLCYDGFD